MHRPAYRIISFSSSSYKSLSLFFLCLGLSAATVIYMLVQEVRWYLTEESLKPCLVGSASARPHLEHGTKEYAISEPGEVPALQR